jgi:hypothetical protein
MSNSIGPAPLRAADPVITQSKATPRVERLAPGEMKLNTVTDALRQVAFNAIGGRKGRAEIGFMPSTNGKTPKHPVSLHNSETNGQLAVRVSVARGHDLYEASRTLALRLIRNTLYGFKGGKATPEDEAAADQACKGIITQEVVQAADAVINHAVKVAKNAALVKLTLAGTPFSFRLPKSKIGEAGFLWLRQLIAANVAAQAGDTTALCAMFAPVSGLTVTDGTTKKEVEAPSDWSAVVTIAVPDITTLESVPVAEASN